MTNEELAYRVDELREDLGADVLIMVTGKIIAKAEGMASIAPRSIDCAYADELDVGPLVVVGLLEQAAAGFDPNGRTQMVVRQQ